jgi:hypothetical protein
VRLCGFVKSPSRFHVGWSSLSLSFHVYIHHHSFLLGKVFLSLLYQRKKAVGHLRLFLFHQTL